jgi:hypothetical protein
MSYFEVYQKQQHSPLVLTGPPRTARRISITIRIELWFEAIIINAKTNFVLSEQVSAS